VPPTAGSPGSRRDDDGLRERLHAIANDAGTATPRADAYEVKALRVRPPVPDPETMLNAAVNYVEHGAEVAGGAPAPTPSPSAAPSVPGLWERRSDDARSTPYLFRRSS
jgi:2-keto-4-pentenoate hydratase/2-oxohepta-3-ene-1,7-dioic acid hydratase in catechol pathway